MTDEGLSKQIIDALWKCKIGGEKEIMSSIISGIRLEAKRRAYEECALLCESAQEKEEIWNRYKPSELCRQSEQGCESCGYLIRDLIRDAAKELK